MSMQGQISEDGRHVWDGTNWVPNPNAAAPAAAAPAPAAQQPMMQQQQPMMQQQQPMMMQQPTTVVAAGGNQPSVLVVYLLWFFLGWLGIHHLYIGRGVGIWLVSLITFQGLGFWWLIDLFLIPSSCSKPRGGVVIVA